MDFRYRSLLNLDQHAYSKHASLYIGALCFNYSMLDADIRDDATMLYHGCYNDSNSMLDADMLDDATMLYHGSYDNSNSMLDADTLVTSRIPFVLRHVTRFLLYSCVTMTYW